MKKKVDITVVLDRSGSMQSIKNETIKGFNEFVSNQIKLNVDNRLTLVQFDHEYELLYEAIDMNEVIELSVGNYVPRGLTALLDAIGKTIKITNDRHKVLKNEELPDKVLFVIITDGLENNSTKFSRKMIFNKIKKMENKHKWEFIFLAANQDAISEAENYGIEAKRAMTFAADAIGTKDMFFSMSESILGCVSNECEFEFTEEQREKQKRNNN